MRAAGLGMIFLSFLLMGLNAVLEKKTRLRGMCELADMLELFRGELELRALPLPDLIRGLLPESRGLGARLLFHLNEKMELLGDEPFSRIWSCAADKCCAMLPGTELEELKSLGMLLGRVELEQQLLALDRCCARLRRRIEEERQALPVRSRLILALSAAAGALLLILLN